ncbi:hypothetical protein QTP81_11150 [Alteromonas sp. ASW11-36]|uniref:Esterase n=1 Tax=Alteromonas arenosi TaxID=3055817 RepID=A0ABT7SY97_9ALTE|nr:hypothetical protein [Alteromonas sp. ASW11-36]MDM7861155.1 hypothetical protein [Alteromonas sp. ASW11-36]
MNTLKLINFLIFGLAISVGLRAEATTHQIKIDTHNITDEIAVKVYVPTSDIQESFPTLYLMDGQHYLYSAVGLQDSLNHRNITIPNFLVVAIDTSKLSEPSGLRHQLLNERSFEMMSILLSKIVPLIESTYPSSDLKIYFGWELAAGFGLELASLSDFNGFLLASAPNLTINKVNSFQNSLLADRNIETKFYVSLGHTELQRIEEHKQLLDVISAPSSKDVDLELSITKNHGYFTTPIDALTNGLMWLFSDFRGVNFYSIEEVIQFGGVDGIINYYEKRSNLYQVPYQTPENTKFTMARHAVKSDNKELLDEIIERLGRFSTGGDYWGYYFAKFAFEKQDYTLAQQFITSSVSTDKTSYRLLTLQGDIETRANRLDKAKYFYEQALASTDLEDLKRIIQNKINALKMM